MTGAQHRPPRHAQPGPTPAAIGRRLVVVGGALLGVGALGLGVRELTVGDPVAAAAGRAGLPASGPPSPTPTAAPQASPARTPSHSAGPSVATARLVEAPLLADRIEDLMERRGGELGLEVVDLRRGEAFRVQTREAYCYSTIKVLILTTVLRQAQEAGEELTERQRSLANRMITRSDNAAAEALLADAGRDEVQRVATMVGMDHTEIDSGWWGLWRTHPRDLGRMVDTLLSRDQVLDGGGRASARFLMAGVVPAQRWGVFTAEQRAGFYVAGKNGWGPLPDGFRVNSTGWVCGESSEYVLSILSRSPNGFAYGRETVGQVAALCHDAVIVGLA